MTKQTSKYSDLSPNQEYGAIDSQWQPSWLQWLISALSGTVETEKQIAWLDKSNADLKGTASTSKAAMPRVPSVGVPDRPIERKKPVRKRSLKGRMSERTR